VLFHALVEEESNMSLLDWRKLYSAPRALRPRRPRRPAPLLRLEALEDRLVPSISFTWDGHPDGGGTSPDNNWTTAANWVGDVAPTPDDPTQTINLQTTLEFPDQAAQLTTTNDFPAGSAFFSIVFTGAGYHLEGAQVALSGIENKSGQGTDVLDLPVSALDNYGGVEVITDANSDLVLNGALSGPGGLDKKGVGTLTLQSDTANGLGTMFSDSLFGGTGLAACITVREGTLELAGTAPDGGANGGLLVDFDAVVKELQDNQIGGDVIIRSNGLLDLNHHRDNIGSLALYGGRVTTEDGALALEGKLLAHKEQFTTTPATIDGELDLAAAPAQFIVDANVSLTVRAAITSIANGSGLIKDGPGTLEFNNASQSHPVNDYLGDTQVHDGTLLLTGGRIPGNLVIGDGNGGKGTAVVKEMNDDQIGDQATVEINADGVLDLNGHKDTVGPVTLHGGSIQTGLGTLTLNGDVSSTGAPTTITGFLDLGAASRSFTVNFGSDLDVSANISGASGAGLSKKNSGTLTLSGGNSYDGPTTIEKGALVVNGTQVASPVTLSDGFLLGKGSVGDVTATKGQVGALLPDDAGIADVPSLLTTGSVLLSSSVVFVAELDGTAPATDYSQLVATGPVDLNADAAAGCQLAVHAGPGLAAGVSFTIIRSSAPVTGQFAGLADGDFLTAPVQPRRHQRRGAHHLRPRLT
jgi:autotransporter-associated beta strand protein